MKHQMVFAAKTWKSYCKAHKGVAAFWLVQALVLLYFVAALFAPKTVVQFSMESFLPDISLNAVNLQEDALVIENAAGDTTERMLSSDAFALTPGAYTVVIDYENIYDVAAPSGSVYDESVVVFIEAEGSQSALLQADNMWLKDATTQQESRIWVSHGEAVDNVQISLYYNGVGRTEIQSITIEEQPVWRWMTLLGVCLLFALLNAGLYLLCGAVHVQNGLASMATETTAATETTTTATTATAIATTAWDKKLKLFFALLGIAVFACLPFFASYVYYGHDMTFHVARIASVAAELANGQFPVRMLTSLMTGYGYAGSVFYCDVFLYLPALLYNCMMPLQMAYQVYAILVSFATVAIAYYCFKRMSHSTAIALVGATLYTLSSYRLSNVYTRASVGEYTAMTFLPLVILGLWCVYKAEKPRYQDWLPLSFGVAGIIQCHVLSIEMIAVFLGIFCVLLLRQTLRLQRLNALVCAVLLCVGLSAWFLVPFVCSYVTLDLQATVMATADLQSVGLTLGELFSFSSFAVGSGYETGLTDAVYGIGWVLLLGTGIALFVMLQRTKWQLTQLWEYKAMQYALLLGGIAMLFTLKIFPWNAIGYGIHPIIASVLNLVQFPWRYLEVASGCLTVAAVLALVLLKEHHTQGYRVALASVLALSICFTGQFFAQFTAVTETVELYNFKTVDTLNIGMGEYMLEGSYYIDGYTTLVETTSDALVISSYEKTDGVAYLSYENTSDVAQTVTLPLWNYPNYQATDTQTGQQYALVSSETNCMQITLEAGTSGAIAIAYVAPWYWHVAEGITLLSWAFVGFMALRGRVRRNGQIQRKAHDDAASVRSKEPTVQS